MKPIDPRRKEAQDARELARRRQPRSAQELQADEKALKIIIDDLQAMREGQEANAMIRDFAAFVNNDVAVKVWLPEKVEDMLVQTAIATEQSQSAHVRTLLFIHVYGLVAYEAMRAEQKGWFRPSSPMNEINWTLCSRTGRPAFPELGKNVRAMKIWLPIALRDDVEKLATKAGKLTSPYLREFLIRHLMGAAYRPGAEELTPPANAELDD